MKKLLVLLIFATLTTVSFGQDTTLFVPNYGIEIMHYEVEQRMPSDTTVMSHVVRFNSKRELSDKVVFYYDVKTYNMVDTSLINHIRQLEVVLGEKELNVTIQGKKIHEWLELMMPPTDTVIQKALAEIAYKFKVIGGN